MGTRNRHRGTKLAVIDGNDIDRVFDVHGTGLKVAWIVVRDGHARRSAGDDGDGGAIRGGAVDLRNSRLVSNVAAGNGGAFATTASVTTASPLNFAINTALLKGNSAAGNGGAVYVSGSPGNFRGGIDRVRAVHNSAGGSGGAIFGSGLGIDHSTVADNRSRGGRRRDSLQRLRVELRRVVDPLGEQRRLLGWRHPHNRRFDGTCSSRGGDGAWDGEFDDRQQPRRRQRRRDRGIRREFDHQLGADTVARNLVGAGHVGGGLYQRAGT